MIEDRTLQLRRKILRQFLRTIVWIDDEIRPDQVGSGGERFRSFFYPTAKEFQRQHLIVHLHPYEADSLDESDNVFDENTSNSFDSASRLAERADVVLLDWHLARSDPKNSIHILQRLSQTPATRYVVLLSEYADQFETEFKKFSGLGGLTANLDLKQKNGAWCDDNGTHVIVMKKPPVSGYSAGQFSQSVLDNIFQLVSKATPDCLHWAAIEMAAKLRHTIPAWLQALPNGTDSALLAELMSDSTEARTFIPGHLLEDLSHLASVCALDSLDNQHYNLPRPVQGMQETVAPNEGEDMKTYRDFVSLKAGVAGISKSAIHQIRKNIDDADCSGFISCQERLAQFCEVLSKHADSKPAFGAVYMKEEKVNEGEKPKVYLCISQECDCIRGFNLLFLEGRERKKASGEDLDTNSDKTSTTRLLFHNQEYEFIGRPENLKSLKIDSKRDIKGYKKVGQLRSATVQRIRARVWNQISRPAINLPTFTRVERAE